MCRGVRNLVYVLRRLFSTFAHGAPGVGLLLLRAVVGIALVFQAGMAPASDPPESTVLYVLTGIVGILVLIGLWTPVAGTVLAVLASWSALLGPGAWSVDARLFGWKRVELPDRKS